jgi:hypothetical protein
VLPAYKDQQVFRVLKDHRGRKVLREQLELLVWLVLQVQLDHLVFKVLKVHKDLKVLREQQGLLALLVLLDSKD